jgi:hypothetical protein
MFTGNDDFNDDDDDDDGGDEDESDGWLWLKESEKLRAVE